MTSASEAPLDTNGLKEVAIMTHAIRNHFVSIADLSARRKQLIFRLHSQRITYKEIALAMGVSQQLVYKIVQPDTPPPTEYDNEGNPIPRRGRPKAIKKFLENPVEVPA